MAHSSSCAIEKRRYVVFAAEMQQLRRPVSIIAVDATESESFGSQQMRVPSFELYEAGQRCVLSKQAMITLLGNRMLTRFGVLLVLTVWRG